MAVGERVGYARVSKTAAEQTVSIAGQVAQLEAAGCSRIISERLSAYSGERPGWQELWQLVAARQVSEVVVVDQSRLSRSGDDLEFLEACAVAGVRVTTLTGGAIEVQSVAGFVAAGVMSIVNRAESKLKSIKTREGIRRRREAGYLGTGTLPFGYRAVDGRAQPDPDHWLAARQQFEGLLAHAFNITAYLRATGSRKNRCGLQRWARHPMLRGFAHGEWGAVEPLITWAEYEQAQRMMAARTRITGATEKRRRAFTGLIICPKCGRALHYVVPRPEKRQPLRLQCRRTWCEWYGRSVRADCVREQVIEALRSLAGRAAEVYAAAPREPVEVAGIRAQLEQLQVLARQGVQGLSGAIGGLEAQLEALREVRSGPDLEALAAAVAAPGVLEAASDDEIRALCLEFLRLEFKGEPRRIHVTERDASPDDRGDGVAGGHSTGSGTEAT